MTFTSNDNLLSSKSAKWDKRFSCIENENTFYAEKSEEQ